jgi:hypothetical protein
MAQRADDFGSVAISARPATADVYVDGERWVSTQTSGPLVIQLSPGPHRIEVRAPGYRPFSGVVDVRRGETTPLNVSLPRRDGEQPPPPPASPAPPSSSGSIQQVTRTPGDDGFVIAPDFRFSEIGGHTAALAGAYGGAVFAGRFLFGAGGYWQTNDVHGQRLAYGGGVVEWRALKAGPIGINAHGLVGWGQASYDGVFITDGHVDNHHSNAFTYPDPRFRFHDDFAVAEPEVQVVGRFAKSLRLVAGAGYRFTSSHNDDLNGFGGSVSLQFGR